MFKTIKRFFKTTEADKSPTKPEITSHHCVQCGKKVRAVTEVGHFPVCLQPECPNYGLVQVGVERAKEFLRSIKTKIK